MATSAADKLTNTLREAFADANADPAAHEALKRLLSDAPVVARAFGAALTPVRVLSLTSAIGTLLLQRGGK